eukprot:TRINITY_DN30781_c0_g1_i1.p1 TRINITY_DN30781_c0_g1~~TRINITY_DN30781_c0_g1_i1.p1  ORF type:complete len:363 (+),score=47.48 TRINITY_DN30781_c0_g1_i1:66-1154(+)
MSVSLKHITRLLFLIIGCGLGVTIVNVNTTATTSVGHTEQKEQLGDQQIIKIEASATPTPKPTDLSTDAASDASSEVEVSESVVFYCMQTKKASAWCRMLESASHFGITIDHPTWGAAYTHAKRIGWVLQAIKHLPGEAIVSFSDGTDVMFNGGAAEIASRFTQLEKKYSRSLFFNAEKSCYAQQAFPDAPCSKGCKWALRKARCIASYRNNIWTNGTSDLSKWRYLNAGCFIGRVSSVRKFFTKVSEITFKSDGSLRSGVWCDQSMITKILLTQSMSHIVALDIENRIYLPTYHLHSSIDFCPYDSLHVCGSPEGENPLIFHLNGKSASSLHTHPWTGFKANPKAIHKIKGVAKTLSEICG